MAILEWMNTELNKNGKRLIVIEQTYVGLDMAISIVQIGSTRKYWEKACFS